MVFRSLEGSERYEDTRFFEPLEDVAFDDMKGEDGACDVKREV